VAKKMSFEEQMNKLEKIRDELENNELSLDAAIKLYEDGVKVLTVCREQLDKYEARIEELSGLDEDDEADEE
jgi:exodeoxyribonuclease VII small subunit